MPSFRQLVFGSLLGGVMILIPSGVDRALADETDGPRRIALFIGISDYLHFRLGGPPGESDLRGPVNDVMRMRTSLVSYGFTDSANVRVLLDSAASRAGIAAGFAWARSRVRDSSDVVVIYFSGHGAQVEDLDGDEARLSANDRRDEALVPWDARRAGSPAEVVIDDDIGKWLEGFRTAQLTVIVDACFSGTVTRDMGMAIPRGLVGNAQPDAAPSYDRRNASQIESPYPVLTAAGPYETAIELPWPDLNGRYAGVMTYHLTRLLDAGVGTAARLDELLPILRRDMLRDARHTAGVDGDSAARSSVVFSADRDFARRAFYLVTPDGDRYRLNAGAVHGLRAGTSLDVFPPDDAAMSERPVATLLVEAVDDTASYARIVAGGGTSIERRSRAVPSKMPPALQAMSKLAVHVPEDAVDLRRIVEAIPFADMTDSAGAAVRLVREGNGVGVMVDGDPLAPLTPSLPPNTAPAQWITPQVPGAESAGAFPTTPAAVCTALRRAFVARSLASVRNPTRTFAVGIDLRVVKPGSDLATLPPSTVDTLYEGERYDVIVSVTGAGNAPRFLSVAIAGYRGQPLVIFPEAGQRQEPYAFVNKGSRSILKGPVPVQAPYGPERLVAYFGNFDYSLAPLVNDAPVCTAVDATRTRDLGDQDPSISGWTSVERRILILPKR